MTDPIRWRVRAQLRDTGAVWLSNVSIFETRGQSVYIELSSSLPQIERVLLERLSGTSGEVVFNGPDDTLMLDHVTEFLATRPNG